MLSNLDSDSATGPDGISPRVLKTCSSALTYTLSILFTLSFARYLPCAWKSANITALHKKGAKTDPCNYRPISLLPIISKVMESIIALDIKSFLFSNGLISDHQFGFRPGHSTLDMLLLLSQHWRRSSMPDMKSEPYTWTYLMLLTWSGTLPCSPNSLPMVSKAISTHGSQTSSPVTVNVWP